MTLGSPTPIAGLGHGLYPAVRKIVTDALAGGVGSTLPTNVQYHTSNGFTAGSIQRAIELLRERGALEIESRGPLGRVIDSIDIGQCWQAAGLGPVDLLIPPAGLIELDVLAEHATRWLTQNGIPNAILHGHGGHNRLASVATGEHDLAVVSKSTFTMVRPSQLNSPAGLSLVRELDLNTFYGPSRVIVVRRAGEGSTVPRRVAIDRSSPDHVALTNAEFSPGSAFEFVDIVFPRTLAWVRTGRVDAAIWHVTRTDVPLELAGFETTEMEHVSPASVGIDTSRAVMIASPSRPELASVLQAIPFDSLVRDQVREIQEERSRHSEFFSSSDR